MIRKASRPKTIRIIGVDPGKTGALVVLENERLVAQMRIPLVKGTRDINHKAVYQFFVDNKPNFVAQEFVRSQPKNGVKQAFEFGRTCEVCKCIAAVLDLPFCEILPKTWQKLVVGLDHGDVKTSVVFAAQNIWPDLSLNLKADWGRADAAFIALHRYKTWLATGS